MIGSILFVILLIISIFAYIYFNGMVSREETVDSQWAQVENVYQRRADLVKNLVNVVKGYATHEQTTLTEVIEARSKATSVTIDPSKLDDAAIQNFQQVQDGLSSALSKLMVVVEAYPNLKANEGFLKLQAQLEDTEDQITAERFKFNEVAKDYNTYIRKFPKNLFASLFGFDKKAYFKAEAGSEVAPDATF
ncbi:MAG: LemA family protein [Bacteroidetes bacterium]|nr:LemA family protein [Bacteroidota bacterium]MBU1721146.1 LemA family protein [Bacteroidota bacterium]